MIPLTHLEAVLRGWYLHWLAEIGGWPTQSLVLWTALLFALLRTPRAINSK